MGLPQVDGLQVVALGNACALRRQPGKNGRLRRGQCNGARGCKPRLYCISERFSAAQRSGRVGDSLNEGIVGFQQNRSEDAAAPGDF